MDRFNVFQSVVLSFAGLRLLRPDNYTACAGRGLSCRVGGAAVLVGNREWLVRHGLALSSEQEEEVAPLEAQVYIWLYMHVYI